MDTRPPPVVFSVNVEIGHARRTDGCLEPVPEENEFAEPAELIVEHPDWTYRRVAEEVNARIEGAHASEKSVRWYASRMRKTGSATKAI